MEPGQLCLRAEKDVEVRRTGSKSSGRRSAAPMLLCHRRAVAMRCTSMTRTSSVSYLRSLLTKGRVRFLRLRWQKQRGWRHTARGWCKLDQKSFLKRRVCTAGAAASATATYRPPDGEIEQKTPLPECQRTTSCRAAADAQTCLCAT